MNIFADFEQRIRERVEAVLNARGNEGADFSRIGVEPPRDPSHGDLSTNAAMVLAKPLDAKPRDLADAFADALRQDADVETVEVAGPGFINLRLKSAYWTQHLHEILGRGLDYGRGEATGHRVNVEYVSANPTGPLHVGHCRGAVVGDAIANVMAFAGNEVSKEYYINDAGAQIEVLARSTFLRYREALGEAIGEIAAGLYPGDYLKTVGAALAIRYGRELLDQDEAEWLPTVKSYAIAAMMMSIRDDLKALDITQDVFFSEKTLHEGDPSRITQAVDDLRERGFVYQGTLPPPKGQLPEDWEDREQTLLRSTEVGDDVDRPLVKSDGTYTYFAADVAYFADKFARGFDEMVYVLGADHGGYVKRLEAVAKAVAGDKAHVDVVLCQLVKLFRNGEPVRMSKRAGEFVTLADVVNEVGRDPVRFMMLFRKSDAPLDFDFQRVTEQSKDNPVFYVQYAHARARSIMRQADGEGIDVSAVATVDAETLSLLADEGELALIRKLAEYPRLVQAASLAKEPHRLAFYLYDLASAFHGQYNRGKDHPELRFVKANDATTSLARLGLVQAVAFVIASGLKLIGVHAPEEMR
ncbi:arginine--tRNA ligase [Aureimonas phyllosphaerae]|uniref:Arginine--tRNA ligase n=1 Tax=Aureimonas phyllosphaerae TaxID=1166078 RepID=A0A7W6BWK6_9HYPH|nr:arginine--tRNA ligase [Aureimonas phyllosphaerae]MBB3935066.1 arginyl-tRNA synthetase [Aureimonas phyllosphaerae]MBB3959074.1 arginyl-tRNA synthetase [Aureimonas phyllosphaerae]SFF08279.1 arginyl-tRNA synthetase [Aureimonas phyllosphaerae]